MKTVLTLFILSVSSFVQASEPCLRVHLEDAIKLNRERWDKYSTLTNGESEAVSFVLIAYEISAIPMSWYFDGQAEYFQQKGIGLLCDDLIDMKETPKFQSYSADLAAKDYLDIDLDSLAEALHQALDKKDYKSVSAIADAEIHDIESRQGTNCMMKHFLESIRRSAMNLIRIQKENRLEESDWNKLSDFMDFYLKNQIWSFSFCDYLDHKVAKFHKSGVPIICQDIPEIPAPY